MQLEPRGARAASEVLTARSLVSADEFRVLDDVIPHRVLDVSFGGLPEIG